MKKVPGDLQTIRFDAFELDLGARELRRQRIRIRLQELPLRILQMLLENPGQVVSREELRSALWPTNSYIDFDQGLNRAINKLREALADSAEKPLYVETLTRRGYRFIGTIRAEPRPIKALAVLPLQNLSHDPSGDVFADGLTESLITSLARISSLRVTSRTTAMTYKHIRKPAPEIARELNVEGLVEGAVTRAEDRVRISAQLIDARDDSHIWADEFERDARDILSLQADVARAIAARVQAVLAPHEEAQLSRVRTVVPEAFEAYLMGRHHWNRRTPEGLRKATEFFQLAVEKDPTYAAAYASLADLAASAGFWGFVAPDVAYGRALVAARKSLEIEETAEARTALAWALMLHDYDFAAAEVGFRRAIALYENYASVYQWYGHCLACTGRLSEGLIATQRAVQLEPLSHIAHICHASLLWFQRSWEDCISHCYKALDIESHYQGVRWMLANALQGKGDHQEAIRQRQLTIDDAPDAAMFLAELANSYAAAGLRRESQQILDRLLAMRSDKYVMAYWIAFIHAGLNDQDEALRWLELAYKEHSPQLAYVAVDPRFDGLRDHPRFRSLLQTMQLGLSAGHGP